MFKVTSSIKKQTNMCQSYIIYSTYHDFLHQDDYAIAFSCEFLIFHITTYVLTS